LITCILTPPTALGGSKVGAELEATVHAAHDARKLDRAHTQVAMCQNPYPFGVQQKTTQRVTFDRLTVRMHQHHRARRGPRHLVGHVAKQRTRQERPSIGAQDDQKHVADQRFLDDDRRRRAAADHALGVDARAAEARLERVEVGARQCFGG